MDNQAPNPIWTIAIIGELSRKLSNAKYKGATTAKPPQISNIEPREKTRNQ